MTSNASLQKYFFKKIKLKKFIHTFKITVIQSKSMQYCE